MLLRGKAHKFGDDVNTDYIIAGKYKFKTLDMDELAKHVMEDLDPEFHARLAPGDFVVAGRNFGCGSSREQAPLALVHARVGAVIASSFARLFYRNAVNTGLPVVECDTCLISNGDELQVDLDHGEVLNLTRGVTVSAAPLPPFMQRIFEDGGLAAHVRKHGGYCLGL
ncbi:MAG: 3-isopropylmalate dehydratase small subunit [Firmicutes bacterium]|jgi:3-isopropylmalate/(R)-2-methylmalate dehydratase small subunit|nr:3-isopropylmalate dehydratase small subunit [Bacillota bacterium]MDH7496134.1 3-isopropylmalate dehydratase small subunit [Bacillota bacterium]